MKTDGLVTDIEGIENLKKSFSPVLLNLIIYIAFTFLVIKTDPGIVMFVFTTVLFVVWRKWEDMEEETEKDGSYASSLYMRRFVDAFFMMGVPFLIGVFFYYSVLYLP